MKKTIGIVGGIALSLLVQTSFAQEPAAQPAQPVQPVEATKTWDAKSNPTVDSITSKYKDKMVQSRPAAKPSDIFPVLGKFESATNPEASLLTVSLDEQNKGIVWIDGLPQGKVKANLRKSPATYKIPAQKTEDGKEVAEGTLIYDKETNTLRIAIGKTFDAENPEAAFAIAAEPAPTEAATGTKKTKVKAKKPAAPKAWVYTGSKMTEETVMQ